MPDVKPESVLPPDNATAEAQRAEQTTPSTPGTPAPDVAAAEERQSTREWLRSLGMVAGDVAARETQLIEREEAPPQRQERPERSVPRDTAEVLNLLREGDDAQFVEGVVNLSKKRIMDDMSRTERDAIFGQKINQYVATNAPDVPLVVFWAFAEQAERNYPRAVDKQIDWAIEAGRAAMEHHNAQTQGREQTIRRTQEQAETLDGAPTRQRRRGGVQSQERTSTFVEELLAARAKYE